ncbi:MAG: DUF2335 domain-containing protein [Alphaproteobacteria bacterium GM7ARS4]|nr:DUF2335 domain-containing protein [Alphaproteobacteria bacterium GM7ARS4]
MATPPAKKTEQPSTRTPLAPREQQRKSTEVVVRGQVQEKPLPVSSSPEDLKLYDDIVPGMAREVWEETKENSAQRRRIEEQTLRRAY